MEIESRAARFGIISAIGCALGAVVGSAHGTVQAYAYKSWMVLVLNLLAHISETLNYLQNSELQPREVCLMLPKYDDKNREIFKQREMKMRHIRRRTIYSSVAWGILFGIGNVFYIDK